MNKTLLSLIVFSLSFGALHAEEDLFRKGQVFLDLSGGIGTANSPILNQYRTNPMQFLHGFFMLSSPNLIDNYIGIKEMTAPKAEVVAQNKRLEIEYAVTDWLGLGGSVNSTAITIKDAPVVGDYFFLMLLAPNSTALNYFIANAKTDIKMEVINTLDFNISFHFPGNSWIDPFLKLGAGVGTVAGGTLSKGGALLGVRLNVAPHFHLIVDGYANSITITGSGGGGSSGLTETGAHFGLGTNF